MKRDQKNILNVLLRSKLELKGLGVEKIGVFGSFSRGTQKKGSDIDLLVKFSVGKKSFRNYMRLNQFLEDKLGLEVDLVTEESLSPYIGPHIKKEVKYV